MKKYSAEEAETIALKTSYARGVYKSKVAHIYVEVATLLVGEALQIDKTEWGLKNMPSVSAFPKYTRQEGKKYRVNTLADDSGWVIVRVA